MLPLSVARVYTVLMFGFGLVDITNAACSQRTPKSCRAKQGSLPAAMEPWSQSPIGGTGLRPVAVVEGVIATVDRRLAQVIAVYKDTWVRVRWADDGSETLDWLHIDTLSTLVDPNEYPSPARVPEARSAAATLVSINALKAPLSNGELATLVAALHGTTVESICGLSDGQTAANFASQDLTPHGAAVIAAELRLPSRSSTLTSLDVSDNDLLGSSVCFLGSSSDERHRFGGSISFDEPCSDDMHHDHLDNDLSGWNALCDAVKASTALTEFRCTNIGAGPAGYRRLATSLPAQLASLTVTSTGRTNRKVAQREYTLATTATTSGPPHVCLGTFAQTLDGRLGEVIAHEKEIWVRLRWVDGGSYLGIRTASETADWIRTDQLCEHLVKSDCPITKSSMATYNGRLGTVIALEKAVWARMRWIDDGSETLEWINTKDLVSFTHSVFSVKSYRLSSKGLGDADGYLLCTWLRKPEVRAAVTDVDVSGNPLAKNRESTAALASVLPAAATLRGVVPYR